MARIFINNDWLFNSSFKKEYLSGTVDSGFAKVRIPHTVKELPFNYFSEQEYQMLSCYRKVISAPAEWSGKRIFITFEGAAHYAEVFLNSKKIGEHYSGYTAFTIELTDHIKLGEDNILIVKLDSRENLNIPPFGNVIDYMTFGGIYRDVYLEVKEKIYIEDVFVMPEYTGKVASKINIDSPLPFVGSIRQTASFEGYGDEILIYEGEISGGESNICGYFKGVKLWDNYHPYRYLIKTQLFADGKEIDVHRVMVGFRRAEFTQEGFFLNGRRVQIRGLNRHQSYPYVGYAMPESMQRNDARTLKSLGVNAVRTSHYPQSQYFIDECDKLGLLVFTEIPGWQNIGDDDWKAQALKNVEEMVVQYRNHPSIILWGVRINESRDDHELYTRTNELARRLDPTRQTGGVRNFKRSELIEDVYTYNDFFHDGKRSGCEPKFAVTPNLEKPYMITENNGHMFPTKSFDCEEHRIEHALRHARVMDKVASYPDIAGSFAWCFFDYNTHKEFGSGDRICYHGVCDMFRNEKIAAALYKAQGDFEDVLEVGSGMDIGERPACVRGNVWVFTNADSVKVYRNDKFIKEYQPKNKYFPNLERSPILIDDYVGDIFETELKFPPQKAKALREAMNYIAINGYSKITPKFLLLAFRCVVMYGISVNEMVDLYTRYVGDWGGKSAVFRFDAIKDGKVVKSVTKTPMSEVHLEVTAINTSLVEKSSYDVGFIKIRAVDENGNLLTYCNEAIKISAEGPIEIIGPELISLRGGMAGVYVKTVGDSGNAFVTFSSQIDKDITINLSII